MTLRNRFWRLYRRELAVLSNGRRAYLRRALAVVALVALTIPAMVMMRTGQTNKEQG